MQLGLALLLTVIVVGTVGYLILGLSPVDSLYQTVTTISTVGFREMPADPSRPFRVFTMVLILTGVGVAFYTAAVLLESVVEGRLSERIGRRRMQRNIDELSGHVVLCGWGRVGRSIHRHLTGARQTVVVVEVDEDRRAAIDGLSVSGDATDDAVMTAGRHRAGGHPGHRGGQRRRQPLHHPERPGPPARTCSSSAGCGTRSTSPSCARPAPTGS